MALRGAWLGGLALAVVSAGCGGAAEDTDPVEEPDGGGACGEITEHDLVITGLVVDGAGPVEGAEVWLEERVWHPGGETFGSAATAADGSFTFAADGVVSVEDCWGTALDYVIVAVRGDRQAEDGINSSLYGAITDGEGTVDLSGIPLQLP